VNNRKLMEDEVSALGVPGERRKEVFRLIDRRDKMAGAEWDAYAAEIGLNPSQLDGLKVILADGQLWRKAPGMQQFFAYIDALGLSAYVRYAPQIVRGLDYYTGTVFEAWDNAGEFRAILGGGRYDNLVADVGGEPLPATGFAMGDLVISLVLKKFGCLPPDLSASPAKVLVTLFDAASIGASFRLAAALRQAGVNTAIYPETAKLARQFKYGDRMGMRYAVVLGPDEQAQGNAALKDLRSGEQRVFMQQELADVLRKMLG
jgi:histidyl-tRNA synthetase